MNSRLALLAVLVLLLSLSDASLTPSKAPLARTQSSPALPTQAAPPTLQRTKSAPALLQGFTIAASKAVAKPLAKTSTKGKKLKQLSVKFTITLKKNKVPAKSSAPAHRFRALMKSMLATVAPTGTSTTPSVNPLKGEAQVVHKVTVRVSDSTSVGATTTGTVTSSGPSMKQDFSATHQVGERGSVTVGQTNKVTPSSISTGVHASGTYQVSPDTSISAGGSATLAASTKALPSVQAEFHVEVSTRLVHSGDPVSARVTYDPLKRVPSVVFHHADGDAAVDALLSSPAVPSGVQSVLKNHENSVRTVVNTVTAAQKEITARIKNGETFDPVTDEGIPMSMLALTRSTSSDSPPSSPRSSAPSTPTSPQSAPSAPAPSTPTSSTPSSEPASSGGFFSNFFGWAFGSSSSLSRSTSVSDISTPSSPRGSDEDTVATTSTTTVTGNSDGSGDDTIGNTEAETVAVTSTDSDDDYIASVVARAGDNFS